MQTGHCSRVMLHKVLRFLHSKNATLVGNTVALNGLAIEVGSLCAHGLRS